LNIVFIFNCFLGIQTRKKIESSNVTVNTCNQHLIRFIIRHLPLSLSLCYSLSHCTTYKVNKNSNGRKKLMGTPTHTIKYKLWTKPAKLYLLTYNINNNNNNNIFCYWTSLQAVSLFRICLSTQHFLTERERKRGILSFFL
jgi:hypothetical protein